MTKEAEKLIILEKIQEHNLEYELEKELQKFFTDLEVWILNRLHYYYNPNLNHGQLSLITDVIMDKHQEYYDLLEHYLRLQYNGGVEEAKILLRLANQGYSFKRLWSYLPNDLLDKVFVASRNTLRRVTDDLKNIISEGYVNGAGVDEVSRLLTRRFDQLRTWEAKRISRTETHNAHNLAIYNSFMEQGVGYTQWITVGDEKVRGRHKGEVANHYMLDGEIIRVGDTYSNGLRYPGDTDGPLAEYINCRCAQAPYSIPYGYSAPPLQRFFEKDLIKIGDD